MGDLGGGEGGVVDGDEVVGAGEWSAVVEFVGEGELVGGVPVGDGAVDLGGVVEFAVDVDVGLAGLVSGVDDVGEVGGDGVVCGVCGFGDAVGSGGGGAESCLVVGSVLAEGDVSVEGVGGEGDDSGWSALGEVVGGDPGFDGDGAGFGDGFVDFGSGLLGVDECWGVDGESGWSPGGVVGVSDGEVEGVLVVGGVVDG